MVFMLYLCALIMAVVPHILVTSGEVTLSADAVPAPGGYVVPEGGNITFTCNHSLSDGGVFWKVDLRVPMGRASYTASMGVANLIPQVSSPDNATKANPATIIISNITSENNRSSVECSRDGSISDASIIVEGSPNCPTVSTTVSTTLLAVSVQKTQMRWLPEWYYTGVSYYDNGSVVMVYNSTLKDPASFDVTPVQPNTGYTISVISCNMAGCNESCNVHSVETTTTEAEDPSRSEFGINFTVLGTVITVVALLAITMVATALAIVIVAFTCKRKQKPKTGGEGHYEDIVAVELPMDNVVIISTSLQDPKSSSMDADTPAAATPCEESGRGLSKPCLSSM